MQTLQDRNVYPFQISFGLNLSLMALDKPTVQKYNISIPITYENVKEKKAYTVEIVIHTAAFN